MKSKITKIQILKEGMAILLVLMFVLTPIVSATTSLDDSGDQNIINSNVANNVVDNTTENNTTNTTGNNTVVGDSGSESGSSSSGLNWKEIFDGKVGAAAEEIKDKIAEFESDKTKPRIIEINDEIQLRAIAELVNNGENNFKGITIILTDDIVINSDVEWIPIGIDNSEDANEEDYYDRSFQGNFIGCELDEQGKVKDITVAKRISNLEYLKEGKTYKELTNIGLFGVIGENATIQNIIIDNFNINVLYDNSDILANDTTNNSTAGKRNTYYCNAGNIAGINRGTIKNCYNLSDIKGGSYVGGFVGTNEGTIINCTNTGVVMGYDIVGGIAGSNKGTIEKCKNTEDVKGAEQDIGGIVGLLNGGTVILSHNTGNVQGNIQTGEICVGGIVGGNYNNGSIKYCMHEGKTIYNGSTKKIYGILGNMDATDDAMKKTVIGCITKVVVSDSGDLNQVAYLCEIGVLDWSLLDENEKNWGFVIEDPLPYENYDSGYGIFEIGQSGKIQNIKYNVDGTEYSVFIVGGNRQEQSAGNVIFNPVVKGNNTFDEEGGFDIGAGLDVDIKEDDTEEPVQPEQPVEPEEAPLQEGEVRQDITELFPKTDKDKEDGSGEEDASKTTVSYLIKKGETVITKEGYFKEGDIITVVATFNKYLEDANGNAISATTAPILKIGNDKDGYKDMVPKAEGISNSPTNATTTIVYEYEVQDGDNFKVENIKLSGCKGIKAIGKEDTAIGIEKEVVTKSIVSIYVDTICPTLKTKIYVENNLETKRYTAGKEILFEVTVSEVVNELYTVKPLIQVSFSESGTGLYNYYIEKDENGNDIERRGIAKFRSDLTPTEPNEDGTITWKYSYQIQEGDEGELEADYIEYEIVDLAGNRTSSDSEVKGEEVTGSDWGAEDLNITYNLYDEDGKEITEKTVLTEKDTLLVEVQFDKVLYTSIGNLNKDDVNTRLNEIMKGYAPSLYLNGNSLLKQTSIKDIVTTEYAAATDTEETKSGTTTITYEYNFADIIKEYNLDKTIRIKKLVLKNDNNASVTSVIGVGGEIAYSEEWHSEFKEAEEALYGLIAKNAIKELEMKFRVDMNPSENIFEFVYDVLNGSVYDGLYADTTLPTVQITTNTTDPTKAEEIIYTFKFSEFVKGFAEDDITVNGGYKATRINDKGNEEVDFTVVKEGYEYTLKVIPTIPAEKEGILQIVVEKGACLDLVAKELVRQEKNITIDKVKPTFIDYNVEQKVNEETGRIEVITVTAIFSEELLDTSSISLVPTLTIDGSQYKGTLNTTVEGNKIIYVYNTDAADGGKVEFSLNGTVKDKAGNSSEEITLEVENNITLEQVRIKDANEPNVYYTFSKNGVAIPDYTKPTYFKAGDTITVTKYENVEGEETKTTDYIYEITEEIASLFQSLNGGKPVQMPFMLLIDSDVTGVAGTIEFALQGSNYINISEANIYFDVVAPSVTLSVEVEEQNEDDIYEEGKELIITATTSEAIKEGEIPEIKVSFTNSGSGKYNKGIAKYEETITNENGSTTWKYKYVAQDGDDGQVIIEYAKAGEIFDLAGNKTELKTNPTPSLKTPNLEDEIKNSKNEVFAKVEYVFYKNGEPITDFTKNTYFAKGDKIGVDVKFDKLICKSLLEPEIIEGTEDKIEEIVPSLVIDDKQFTYTGITNTEITTISYSYTVNEDKDSLLSNLSLRTTSELCAKIINEPENEDEELTITYEKIKGTISDKNIEDCNLRIFNSSTTTNGDINIDTVKPRVSIKANVDNPTNSDKITYTFEFTEEVTDFTEDDITVNGGSKGNLEEETKGKVYKLEVTPDVAEGNEGNVQVIVEKEACKDKVGLGNVRAESVIKVDRKAPTLLGLEAYAPTDSNIILNENINVAKEYYKEGDTLKIIATFDESITTEAKLSLQFGGKNAKGTVIQEGKTGNKITYTYTIVDGDEGILSVGSFRGDAIDAAGNEITVTKRNLSGDTIIADTTAPNLKELKVVSPDTGVYKADTTITIEAIYDEEIYILEGNEIKLVDTMIEVEAEDGTISYTNNAPALMIRFGNGEAKEATVSRYGTKEDGSVDRTKLIYTYTIVGEQETVEIVDGEEIKTIVPGDNGKLAVVLYANRENVQVCDIAGNVAKLNKNLTGNEIIADTTRPTVENITAVVENPTIRNTGIYHKAGNKIKITLEFDEEVSSAVIMPEILVGFSENPEVEPASYNNYSYESDWNVNSTTIEYTYTVKDGDNGYLWVKVPENQFRDVAGNGNVEKAGTKVENVFADTTDPYLATNSNANAQWEIEYVKNPYGQVTGIKAVGIFNEKIFSMNDNSLIELNDIPLMGVFVNGSLQKIVEVPTVSVEDEKTKLTYEIDVTDIDTTRKISVNFIDGKVYDRAGNEMSIELVDGDISSPIFKDIKVVTPNGFYKAGEVIEIVARFEEETKLVTVPNLKVKLGDKEITLTGKYNSEDSENTDTIKVAKYTYEIVEGDNGALNVISLIGYAGDGVRTGEKISQIYIDLTDDDIDDVNGEEGTLLNSTEEPYANNQEEYVNVIADTIKPYITSVKAIVDGKEIASYTKEDGKDAVINVGRTNANELEYVVTFSELVNYENSPVELLNTIVYNGIIKEITPNDPDEDGYYDQIVIKVQTTTEGVQSLMIPDDVFEDRAGNTNIIERFNIVTTDFTKPIIRFISEYNGGIYVLPTNIGKIEARPNVEISEDIAKIEYKWDNEEYAEIENYSTSSDIAVPTKAFTEPGTHVLYIKVVDLAGNVSETSKTYEIINSSIDVTLSTEEYTNQDLTITVEFGRGLTDNRKVTFKAEKSGEIVELNAIGTDENENTQYTITENGTIYAEATDKIGNKVFTERTITNIDKEAPVVEITLDGADLVIGTGRDKATIKTDVELSDNNWVEDAKFAYLQEDIDIYNMNVIDKAKITSELDNEAKIENAESTKGETPYYLYVIAKDKAGNETIEKAGPFSVLDTNERTILETVMPDTLQNIINTEDGNSEPETVEKIIPAEIEVSKLITFNQEGKYISISYNNFGEGEEYLDIIKEKDITLTEERDGYIDYEYYSYVEVNKPTTITVVGKDACENEVIAKYEVTKDSIEGPEFEVIGNPEDWTNQDVKLEVLTNEILSALTVNGTDILSKDEKVRSNIVITENGDYKFVATDEYGNTSEKVISVTKIDKDNPVITKVESSGKDITITSEDATSGVAEYAITETTEVPVEWSKSNVIKVTNDGIFYAWAKDKAGNITRAEEVVIVDTTAPTITFNYTLLTVVAGVPIEANIITDEDAIISYSWDEETWVNSEEFITNVRVAKKYDMTGKYTLYAKATDKAGNESKVQTIEFTVTKPEEDIVDPKVIFEDLPTIQVDGVHYVKVAADMTAEDVTNKMDKEALCGVTPEYTKLAEGNDLKTGSEITLNGDTKYIVVVNGDVNCDGKVGPIDVTYANSIRLNKVNANIIQKLAADFDLDGVVKPIDITMINSYRLGKIKGI